MQNKPNFRKAENFEMVVTLVKTSNYNNEQRTMNYELLLKQTQTNPIYSKFACTEFVEVSNLFQTRPCKNGPLREEEIDNTEKNDTLL